MFVLLSIARLSVQGNDDDHHHHDVSGDLLFAFSSALASLSSPVCRISKWCTRCYHCDDHHCDAMVMVMVRRFMMYLICSWSSS